MNYPDIFNKQSYNSDKDHRIIDRTEREIKKKDPDFFKGRHRSLTVGGAIRDQQSQENLDRYMREHGY